MIAFNRFAQGASRRQLLAGLAVALGAVSIGSGAYSLAFFTDQDVVDANAFTTGTIVLTTSPTTALIGYTNMLPGDSVTSELTITNGGTGALRYSMTSASTDADLKHLRTVLLLEIRQKAVGTCSADFTGTVVFASAAISTAAFGNVAPGPDAGDRSLAFGASEKLCFRASLPGPTGNSYQSSATTATFTFDSEQTANNP